MDPMSETPGAHYFTTPQDEERRSRIRVELRGREVTVETAGGVFSPKGLDKGTAILLEEVPDPTGTQLLDLGCGWGPVAIAMAQSAQTGARVTAVDVNDRSLGLTRDNAAAAGLSGVEALRPEEVPGDRRYDTIWTNPPIRIGKDALHELLLLWLPRLADGGTAWLVVQKNLGADSLQSWVADALPQAAEGLWTVRREATSKGFRILTVSRG
ncbi:class I SAM-dependent methyltransferase [Kocuria sp. p3-SID1433]|uniref:class I SAM-dependent methyltransferase n=1 Tax=unclassified Kocuria TaxID=2649579 RepID=UPI0021A48FDF|nr:MULTISPECIES: class I SAM-dependent methyltransferase [unclassified Kocuria]MCT1601819.1 class I SAM-dependent methyltransferase [Kocuria sp. p3-SID1428]MCT2179965.1 class I SAM-dependent methyltransferase [Kocuria sp. p3-SID1433]